MIWLKVPVLSFQSANSRGLLVGHPHQFRWLYGVVVAILTFNLADGVLTLFWLVTGAAREANPLMASLFAVDPVAFMVAKMALVSVGCLLLWRYRDRALAVVGIFAAFMAYYLVLLHHLSAVGLALARVVPPVG